METKKDQKEKQSEIPSWALYVGIGATVLAAGVATAYIVKTKREEELKALRAGGRGVQSARLEDFAPKNSIATYWNWTVEAFGKVNRLVSHFLTQTQHISEQNPLVADPEELAVYGQE